MSDQLDLYELINTHVNADTIQELFRSLKADRPDTIKIGGNKPDLIARLKNLVAAGEIAEGHAYNLLRDAEENGNQRIYYFQPNRARTRELNSPDDVGQSLFGAGWEDKFSTPLLTKVVDGTTVVDFRRHPKKTRDWVLKLYGYANRRKFIDRTPLDVDRRYRETWEEVPTRVVLLVRWNSYTADFGWLEFRLTRGLEGREKVHLENLWEVVRPAVTLGDCHPVCLSPAIAKLFTTRGKNQTLYHLRDTEAWDRDENGYAIKPHDPDDGTLDATEHGSGMIEQIVNSGGECSSAVVEWQTETSAGCLLKALKCIIGGGTKATRHQVCIASEVSAAAVDYVTDQLRHFVR